MSFADFNRLPATKAGAASPFQTLVQSLSSSIFRINSNIATTTRLLTSLGTPKDSPALRERLRKLLDGMREECRGLGEGVKELRGFEEGVGEQERFTAQKLAREAQAVLGHVQATQRLAAQRERENILPHVKPPTMVSDFTPYTDDELAQHAAGQQLVQTQEQAPVLANEAEVAFNESLIAAREGEIAQIEEGITELNEIFRDLGTIVTEQGDLLDNIESNVQNVVVSTRGASRELVEAERYQRGARRRGCFLMVIFVVILTVVLLAVLS
ncbi:t-SNARE [Saitoella complicata NRRL Y-17804]|uniref:t-SNARE n=1 Tax=Saitoella complicata (strain BCRC 22490 / CBS 7301 / JCM 7358 / NBRC 10748 / NRRL Y-17804) TaxID=698492 RepID=UPI0008677033|nr:t-SNARE [Saitoella complicata NRRL Y-17804]ODQ50739.1 t-SNARE [Saitoella complicata NRRL Y-17804]